MRKTLAILALILIPFLATGQSKFKKGVQVGESDNVTTIDSIVTKNGMSYFYVGGVPVGVYNDSILILEAVGSTNGTNISGNSVSIGLLETAVDLKLSIADTSGMLTPYAKEAEVLDSITIHRNELDSLHNSLATANYKISVLEGDDITAPGVDSAYINTISDDIIYVKFNEQLDETNNDSVENAFSFTYGSGVGVIDSVSVSTYFAVLYCNESIPVDSTVFITYTRPITKGLHDASFNYTSTFTEKLVFNGVSTTLYVPELAYFFNGNLYDYYDTQNGTAIGTLSYLNDTALYFPGSAETNAVSVPDIITGDHAFSYWIYLDEDANENYYIFCNVAGGSEDGFYHYADGTGSGTFALNYRVGDGTYSTYAKDDDYELLVDTWNHVVVNVDVDNGSGGAYAAMYLNGSLCNSEDTTLTSDWTGPVTVSGTSPYCGNATDLSGGLREGAVLGEFILFDERLDQSEIDSLYAIGGGRLWYLENESTTTYDTTYTIYEEIDFADAPLGEISDATYESMLDGALISSGHDNRYLVEEIVEFDEDTVFEFLFLGDRDAVGLSNLRAYFPSSFTGLESDDINQRVIFSYNVFFPLGFYFSGGKMPGISIENQSGGQPDGGIFPYTCLGQVPYDDLYLPEFGCSMRCGLGSQVDDGHAEVGVYLYYHNMYFNSCANESYGGYWPDTPAENFTLGTWHNISVRYVENTVITDVSNVVADGLLEYYFDGVLTFKVENMIMRKYKSQHLDLYYLNHGFGGSATTAPERPNDQVYYVDGYTLWYPNSGHSGAIGNASNPIGYTVDPPNRKDQ